MSRRLFTLSLSLAVCAWLSVSAQSTRPTAPSSGATLVGSIVDAALAPVSGVAVTLEHGTTTPAKTSTDATGAFRFQDVVAGDYRVRADKPGFSSFSRDLHVRSGMATVRFPIVLVRAIDAPPSPQVGSGQGLLTGVVTDSAGGSIPGATVRVTRNGTRVTDAVTDATGRYRISIAPGTYDVTVTLPGFRTLSRPGMVVSGGTTTEMNATLQVGVATETVTVKAEPPVITAARPAPPAAAAQAAGGGGGRGGGAGRGTVAIDSVSAQAPVIQSSTGERSLSVAGGQVENLPVANRSFTSLSGLEPFDRNWPPASGEAYAHVDHNRFQSARDQPLSTFGADVDTASYSNVRRFLSSGQLPPGEAVRVEEFVNYFKFGYAEPRDGKPIALTTEIGDCPWAPSHKLVLIGARAKASSPREIEGRNIVLLIDVSGSMQPAERLPLIKTALGMFADTLRPDDRLAIVTYAGTSGIALPSTEARHREVIQRAIAGLSAGGSTNGGQGLIMAYRTAREAFIPGGVNRVILATDGDFNVGIVGQSDLLHLIERERDSGVFLSVFGVGSGNLKDATMEMLADKGNGHYAYLDSLQEARRVLVREGDATLETVAKDVKFQVEFNPAVVSAWKLIGYENRALAAQDFNNNRKDAGEMGAGHTVTVLYEVVPVGVRVDDRGDDGVGDRSSVDPLRYQTSPTVASRPVDDARGPTAATDGARSGEWLTVKARYKAPEGEVSQLISQPVRSGGRIQHLPLASAVAEFALLLRSQSRNIDQWNALARRVEALPVPATMTADKDGFKELVDTARALARLR